MTQKSPIKAVILAGGLGSRLAEETGIKPKPMIEIGGRPILWHIMKIYSTHGINEFIICLGYKGYMVKEYFSNYFLHMSDVTFDFANNSMDIHKARCESWRVTLIDTGASTMTGGRLRRIRPFVADAPFFCMTYGDGVGDVDITASIAFHQSNGRLATVTGMQPPGRFGALAIDRDVVTSFQEKPLGDGGWVNGGFFVLNPTALDTIVDDASVWEREPMECLARENQLGVFKHHGFWQPMDTLRDRTLLEQTWAAGTAPWKTWHE